MIEDTYINSTDKLHCGWGGGVGRISLLAKMTNRNCKATSLLPTFFFPFHFCLRKEPPKPACLLDQREKTFDEKENTWINSKLCFFDLCYLHSEVSQVYTITENSIWKAYRKQMVGITYIQWIQFLQGCI